MNGKKGGGRGWRENKGAREQVEKKDVTTCKLTNKKNNQSIIEKGCNALAMTEMSDLHPLKIIKNNIYFFVVEVLLNVHRNRRFIRDGSPGRPPRLSHSF